MKYSKLYIIPVLVASLASCTKAEGPEGGVSPEERAVSICVGVDLPAGGASGVEAAGASSAGVGVPGTRAEGSTPYAGSTLGLFLDYGESSTYTQSNVLWSNDGSNNWTTAGQMLWGKSSDKVGVYAYAPYLEGQTDASSVQFSIPTDQSEGLGAADLLWWYKGIEDGKKADVAAENFEDGKIDIAFRHALIKLTVNFTLASQFYGQDISIKEAWFHGSGNKVKIDFSGLANNNVPCVERAIGPSYTSCSIKMHNCSADGKLSCEVLFFPQRLTEGSKLLTVTLSDGRDYILTLDKDLGLWERTTGGYVTGVAYEMTVTVGKDKLEGGVITVSPWTEKGRLGGDKKIYETDATEYSKWDGKEIAKAYAGGTGTSDDPYQIATAAQLAYMAQECNEGTYNNKFNYFKLTADIDLQGLEWTPIGEWSKAFKGVFEGGGHVITNLKVNNGNVEYAGLFGWVSGDYSETTEIKNLVIRNAFVSSANPDGGNSGIVAGYCDTYEGNCKITGCKVDGKVSSNYYSGGILGRAFGEHKMSIIDCTTDVNCTVADVAENSRNLSCGGIVGRLTGGTIVGCTVRGNVEGMEGTESVGGLAGTLINSSTGDVGSSFNYVYAQVGISKASGKTCYIGGLAGMVVGENHKIYDCIMYGKVWCAEGLALDDVQSFYIGGIIGTAQNVELGGCHYRGSITVGKPANGKLYAGVFIGELMSGVKATNNNSYMLDGAVGLPVYGYKADGVDDPEIDVEAIE